MFRRLVRGGFSALKWALRAVGAMALLLTRGWSRRHCTRPPELASISAARGTVDRSTLPRIERISGPRRHRARFTATIPLVRPDRTGRDRDPRFLRLERRTIHALAAALAARGVESLAVDIRGHGASGTRGDIGYLGQLEDDLADLVGIVRKTVPSSR